MQRLLRRVVPALGLSMALAAPLVAHAQTGGPYAMAWSVIAGGGGASSGGAGTGYELRGGVGQTCTGPLAGGGYSLIGGLWGVGDVEVVGVDGEHPVLPTVFRVFQNLPNPFSTQTTIVFELPRDSRVQMEVHNLKGERVRTLLDQSMPAGRHSMTWAGIGDDGRPLPPGVYWIRTQANDRSDVRKAVLVK